MKLPGWLFMAIGAGVMAYSKFVEARNGANLALFFWLGVAFIVYGFGKEVVHRMNKPKKVEEKARPPPEELSRSDHRHPGGHKFHGKSQHESHTHTKPHKHHSHPHQPAHKKCPSCHANTVHDAGFCHKCGFRF